MSTRRVTRLLSGSLAAASAPLSTKAGVTKTAAKTKKVNSKITASLKIGKASAKPGAKGKTAVILKDAEQEPVQLQPEALAVTQTTAEHTTKTTTVVGEPDPILRLDADRIAAELEAGLAHIAKIEPRLKQYMEKDKLPKSFDIYSRAAVLDPFSPFTSLTSGIISQQVSGAAAKSIKTKFVDLFGFGRFPTPAEVLTRSVEELRTAGLSQRKAEYVRTLAEHFVEGKLKTETFVQDSNEEITKKLVAVRGLGVWSAEMFLIFNLRRMDVFSVGDLGIQRGMAVFAGKDVNKLKTSGKGKWKYMSEQDMLKESERFAPYRSLYCLLAWSASDTSVASMSTETDKNSPKKKAKTESPAKTSKKRKTDPED